MRIPFIMYKVTFMRLYIKLMVKPSGRRTKKRSARQVSAMSQQPVQVQQPDPVAPEQPTKPKKKRITFDVDLELHKKAFMYARRQGITIKDLLTNFLEQETVNEKI